MREDLDYHRGLFDGGDDLEVPATLWAMFEIDSENSLEQACPAYARRRGVRVFVRRLACTLRWTRHDRGHDRGAQPGIGGEHAVKAD